MLGLSNIHTGAGSPVDRALNNAIDRSFYSNNNSSTSINSSHEYTSTTLPRYTVKHYYPEPKPRPKYYTFFDTKFNGFDKDGKVIWKN